VGRRADIRRMIIYEVNLTVEPDVADEY